MSLKSILLLGFSAAFVIIGIDQTITVGFEKGYWAFMIALALFFFYYLQKARTAPGSKKATRKPAGGKRP